MNWEWNEIISVRRYNNLICKLKRFHKNLAELINSAKLKDTDQYAQIYIVTMNNLKYKQFILQWHQKKITYLGVNLRDERTVHWKLQNVAERNQNRHQQMKRHILFMN